MTRVEHIESVVTDAVKTMLDAFDDKLAYDESKQRQIDTLHRDLQDFRQGLLEKATETMAMGLIRLHTDICKVSEGLRRMSPEELTPERFYNAMDGFAEDVEILLEEHQVRAFREDGEVFDPARQRVLDTTATDDAGQSERIADRIRPGFERTTDRGTELLKKELVVVYTYEEGA